MNGKRNERIRKRINLMMTPRGGDCVVDSSLEAPDKIRIRDKEIDRPDKMIDRIGWNYPPVIIYSLAQIKKNLNWAR